MALGPRLDLRQSQSLVMTPQLQQAIRLLALSNIEIETFLAGEMERNPLLDVDRGAETAAMAGDGEFGDERGEPVADPRPAETDGAHSAAGRVMNDDSGDAARLLDVEENGAYAGEDATGRAGGDPALRMEAMTGGGETPDFDSFAGTETGLHEHLMEQAGACLSGPDLLIAGQLIGQIDAAGYLEADLLATAYAMGVPRVQVETVLSVIQTFDPTGVGARSLSECLTLQAREADRYDPAMALLLANLDLLARGALPQLRRICGVDEEDMADMIRELRAYDPKPGLRFGADPVQPVIPDLFVTAQGDGWGIEINAATLPRLLVNRRYYAELSAGMGDKTSRAWLSDCLASANWLIKALDQRQRTIVRVATEIVKQQDAFFRHGVAHLRPLTLRTVADAIGMHESTVSRVTSNKYLSCARGLYELKYFFTSGIGAADGGEAVSAQAVKSRIRALILAENPRKILSDDTLVDLLRADGFDIARRTVAKYREAMGIGSSVQRRRQHALNGG